MAEPAGFVLIHGGGLGPWVWDRLRPLLRWPAVAAQRIPPGGDWKSLTLQECARFVERQIVAAGLEKVIVVGHSIGGVVGREAAVRAPQRVAGVAFLAANVPAAGKKSLSMLPLGQHLELALGQWLARRGLTPRKALHRYIKEKLCHDLDGEATGWMLERGTSPEPSALFFQRSSPGEFPAVPKLYVKLTLDRALHPSVQDRMAAGVGAMVKAIESGHTVMLSRPRELAAVLNEFAGAVFGANAGSAEHSAPGSGRATTV
jgi:pimeloyl-ACP methyl ester carboxylesterase